MLVIKHKQLIFTQHICVGTHTNTCTHAVGVGLLCLWHCINTGRYVTPEQRVGNDAVQSLITGSRENREFTHGRIGLALGRRLEA